MSRWTSSSRLLPNEGWLNQFKAFIKMKQMTCAQTGGPATCTVMVPGSTPEEMVGKCMEYIKQAHPEMASGIAKMPREETEKWFAEFKKRWNEAPEK